MKTISLTKQYHGRIVKDQPAKLIQEWLAVSRVWYQDSLDFYMIFKMVTGKPLFDIVFSSEEDALAVATWIENNYRDYFYIWSEYPEMDVLSMAKWSISNENGLRLFEAVQLLEKSDQVISKEQFGQVHQFVQINHWKGLKGKKK